MQYASRTDKISDAAVKIVLIAFLAFKYTVSVFSLMLLLFWDAGINNPVQITIYSV